MFFLCRSPDKFCAAAVHQTPSLKLNTYNYILNGDRFLLGIQQSFGNARQKSRIRAHHKTDDEPGFIIGAGPRPEKFVNFLDFTRQRTRRFANILHHT